MYDSLYDLGESEMEMKTEPTLLLDSLEKTGPQNPKAPDISEISDEAVLIFTWVVFGVLCQVIDVVGIVTNIVNIICFVKQGVKDSVNISLLGKKSKNFKNYLS